MDIAQMPSKPEPAGAARELRDSLLLLTLTLSCLGAYVGLGVVAVKIFGGR